MKRIIYNLYLFLFLAGIASSCTEERLAVWNPENSRLTISFSTSELDSRTVAGDSELNENKVSKIACYIYFGNNGNTNNADAIKMIDINTNDASSETAFTISFTDEELNSLATVNTLTLYAVANPPANIPMIGTTKIPTIKKHSLVDTEFSQGTQPSSFVMDGQLLINVNKKANGSLEYTFPENDDVLKLTRSAAKIMLHVHANNVTDNGTTWVPQTNDMKVSFHNGVKYGYIDAGTNIYMPESETTPDYFFSPENSVAFNPEAKETPEGSNLEYIQQNSPFYSYPYQWTGVMDTAPYLMLVIPWKKADDPNNKDWVYYYYQIPINDLEGKCLERNHFYKIFVDVKALGSLVPTEKVTLDPSYVVVEWGGPLDIPVSLKQYRYLIAEQNEYVMNNVNTIDIPFITSHECELAEVIVQMDDLRLKNVIRQTMSGTLNDKEYIATKEDNYKTSTILNVKNEYEKLTYPMLINNMRITLDDETSRITINHVLDNDRSDTEYDYCPIYITIKLWHKSDNNYVETFKVTQYPMMYVEAECNTGTDHHVETDLDVHSTYTSGWNKLPDGDDRKYAKGWVFVDGSQEYIFDSWRQVRGCYNSTGSTVSYDYSTNELKDINTNPNMYIVTVTALDSGSDYIIGDPRTGGRLQDSELYNDGWETFEAKDMSGNKRRLSYYNPTRTDNENIIAPKFRIASSYSKLLCLLKYNSQSEMQKRCATYQEQGYPAGRWRLPTVAELRFILQLCMEKKIPHLFQQNNIYCTATDSYRYNTDNGTLDIHGEAIGVVRPVYDDWYWTDKLDDKTKFTWGDKPL